MLPRDSTLRTIKPLLADADLFVSRAFGVLTRFQRDYPGVPIVLRIGVTGTGQFPNYRIEDAEGNPIAAIDGANHGLWSGDDGLASSDNWSGTVMTLADVRELLGEIRNFKLHH